MHDENTAKCFQIATILTLLHEIDIAENNADSRFQSEVEIPPILLMRNDKIVKITRKCTSINVSFELKF